MDDGTGKERIGKIEVRLLNAYIDGELDERSHREVEDILRLDPDASRYIVQVKKLNALTRISLDAGLNTPGARSLQANLNERLDASLTRNVEKASNRRAVYLEKTFFAVAASVLLLLAGYQLGSMSLESEVEKQLLTLESKRSASLAAMVGERNRVLEYLPSGQTSTWQSNDGFIQAELMPIRTLRTEENQYCREYRELISVQGKNESVHGISCRTGKAQWKTKFVMPNGESKKM